MAYATPQIRVFQDLSTAPLAAANRQPAHISGGHAFLLRYQQSDEQPLALLGYYDSVIDTPYDWPNRPAGAKVDQDYVKVWLKDALLQYFTDAISASSLITKTGVNTVKSATVNFATHGAYTRSSVLLDRDVQIGDVVKVRGIGGSGSVTLWSYVKSLIGDPVDDVVAAATADSANQGTQSASASVVKTAGADNCVHLLANASAYDGRASGFVDETYDILVTGSSLNGDFSTATVRVISGSGTDDQLSVSPAVTDHGFTVGTRGLSLQFTNTATSGCSDSSATDGVSPHDLIQGQRWRVTVHGQFAAPVFASSGDYADGRDTSYVVEVLRGGLFTATNLPLIVVTTNNGIDTSGPTVVTASGVAVAIGSHGVLGTFTGTGLRKGDRYYIDVTGETTGPIHTIELGHNLDSDIADDSEVDLTLYIRVPNLLLPKNRVESPPDTNWTATETQITLLAGATAYDSSWTDGGVLQPLEVFSEETKHYGKAYAEYRAWRSDLCTDVYDVADVGLLDSVVSGPLHPDNPLKYGAFKALENSGGTPVKLTSVCDPDSDDSWATVLELLLGRDDVYELVPLTRRQTVLELFAAHVQAQSTAAQGLWRTVWFSLAGVPEIPLVSAGSNVVGHVDATTTDGQAALATFGDDPDTAGTQYTICLITSENANLLTNGVKAGDILRALYTVDGFGNQAYSEFVIDDVQSEDQVRLVTGPTSPPGIATKVEIWRTLDAEQESDEIARTAGAWANRRIRAVWPDEAESGTTLVDGQFVCCSVAGLASGVLPQQGLTRLQILGYTSVARTTRKFTKDQLDKLAGAGTWIVTQDPRTGDVFTRHAVTTSDTNDINQREEMLTRNLDSLSYQFKDELSPFIGITNVTPNNQERIRLAVENLIKTIQNESASPNVGPRLLPNSQLLSITPDPVNRDRYIIVISAIVPYALNAIDLHIAV
jgi:hypothetical protein